MKNPNAESCQAFFNMYIPEEAFISDFRMRIKDETFVAKVETKEQAKKIFEGSVGSSGLVSSKVEFKETNHVRTVNTGLWYLILSEKYVSRSSGMKYSYLFFRLPSLPKLMGMTKWCLN